MGHVIALSGWKGSGKDTVAQYLVSKHGYKQLSFATALKDYVAIQYDIPREYLDDQSRKEMLLVDYPVRNTDAFSSVIHQLLQEELKQGYWTPRALLILEGSIKRAVTSEYWVRRIIEEIVANPDQNYVISDMRYRSELEQLQNYLDTVTTVRIQRWERIDTLDPSERDLDYTPHKHQLFNTDISKETLYAQIDHIITALE